MTKKLLLLLTIVTLPLVSVTAFQCDPNAPLTVTLTPFGYYNKFETVVIDLPKGRDLDINVLNPVQNPSIQWHNRGFQEKLPDVFSKDEQPDLLNSVTAEIWYGSDSLWGGLKFGMKYCFHCFSSNLVDPNQFKNEPNIYPLVYHIKASNVAGTSFIYFYYFVENKATSSGRVSYNYAQKYFNPRIEIRVK
jgi:hypothetical protein